MNTRPETYVDTFDLKPAFIIENDRPDHINTKILGNIFNDMIWNLAIESEQYVSDIIKSIEKYYNIVNISKFLKEVNSPFTSNNPIMYFTNGEAIRRTTSVHILQHTIKKIQYAFIDEIIDNSIEYDNLVQSFYMGLLNE